MTEAVTTDAVDAGDHACLTFTDREERLDLVAAFVRDGLRAGLKVLCFTDAVSGRELAAQLSARGVRPGAALRRGQLRVAAAGDALVGAGTFTATGMVQVLAREIATAGKEGYPGLRVTGQVDYRHRDILEQALAESLRLDRHTHLNLAGLEYIDGACAGLIVAAATRLSASRRITVTCGRAVATVLALCGADAAPRLRVQHAHG
jgi:anti-anti-sigma regulatory factor